jgi:hypothetical protein
MNKRYWIAIATISVVFWYYSLLFVYSTYSNLSSVVSAPIAKHTFRVKEIYPTKIDDRE